jgi:hypothetical protein
MSLHNPTLRDLNSAVRASREAEDRARKNLTLAIKGLKERRCTEDEILTYIVRNSGLDLYNAKRFLK